MSYYKQIKNVDDLFLFIGLHDINFAFSEAISTTYSVWNFTNAIWEQPTEDLNSVYDLNHSLEIIRLFNVFDKKFSFSDYEKIVFLIAALIHDIGLQYNFWAPRLPKNNTLKITKKMFDKTINFHGKMGMQLIKFFIDCDEKDFGGFPQICDKSNMHSLELLRKASVIGFSHNDNDLLAQIFDKANDEYKQRIIKGYIYRPRLLAGLLFLCDEFVSVLLDNQKKIILPTNSTNEVNHIYWVLKLVIESISINLTDIDLFALNIEWKLPKRFVNEYKNIVRLFIEKYLVTKNNLVIDQINSQLLMSGELNNNIPIICNVLPPEPQIIETRIVENDLLFMKQILGKRFDFKPISGKNVIFNNSDKYKTRLPNDTSSEVQLDDTMHKKLRVFICHSSDDKPIVCELYKRLKNVMWIDPWIDEEKIIPGQNWILEIEKAVEKADIVIVCLSTNSVNKEGYIQKELKIVLEYFDQKPEGTIYIIPIRLEECKPPNSLKKLQFINYFPESQRDNSYKLILKSLQERRKTVKKI